ncbi:MAG: hypothetical protein AB8B47_12685 [Roseobacter sp.]
MPRSETDLIVLQVANKASKTDKRTRGLTVFLDGASGLASAKAGRDASCATDDQLKSSDAPSEKTDVSRRIESTIGIRRFQMCLQDRPFRFGARALMSLWGTLPGWRWAERLVRIPGVPFALGFSYRALISARPVFSNGFESPGGQAKRIPLERS